MIRKSLFPVLLALFLGFCFTGVAAAQNTTEKELEIIDVSEIQLDGASTLSVTFNIPLKRDQNFSEILGLVDTKNGKVDGAWELKDSGSEIFLRYLEPERKLILSISTQLTAENGKRLRKEYSATIETKKVTPSIGFASTGVLLPVRLSDGLPVVTMNVNKVDVDFFRIRDKSITEFLRHWNQSRPLDIWDSNNRLKDKTDLVYSARFDLNPKPHRRETQYLPISDIRQLREPGAYFAVMRQAGAYSYYMPATFFTLSDIGISVHRYGESLNLFSQSLATGRVLSDVKVTVFDAAGHTLATGETDKSGHVALPNQGDAKGILAQKGRETTLLMLNTPALDLSEFSITGPKSSPLQFFVFSPRDLYRPGEIVPLNGLLRDIDGKAVTAQPISVTVQQPDGKTASTFTWSADKANFYNHKLHLSDNAPTGRWRLLFDLGGGDLKNFEFLVEDFLPERMALEIKGHDGPLLKKDPIKFKVTGRYLYGAPTSGNLLTSQLFVGFLREAVPSLPGYQFGSITERAPYNFTEISDVTLNKDGEAEISISNRWDDTKSPILLNYQASLQESGGRSVTRRFSQPLWPADTLPGIRGLFPGKEKNSKGEAYVDANSTVKFEVVLADRDGNKLASDNLRVRMIRERRDYYWVYSDDEGWDYRYDEKFLTLFDENVRIEKGGIGEVSFTTDWGPYRVEVQDPKTGLVSSLRFWAGYSWQDNTQAGAVRPDQVKMALDKPAYKEGELVKVTLTPPATGSGYLMVESADGPLWWQPIIVPSEGKTFEFHIPSSWARHDLYVSALVVRPGNKKAFQTPKRAVGLLHLPIDRSDRKIDLAINAPEKMRPNGPLTIQVRAKDALGRIPENAQVIISAVDVGILNITDFKTPDPHKGFFTRKAYGADQLDIYGNIIEAGKGARARLVYGGDAATTPGGKKPDTSVLIVALQSDALSFDENGLAEVTLDIPDFNGTLRLMAQVWTGDKFGVAEGQTLVAAPLVMEVSMPRFLAGNDETRLALDLTNLSGEDQEITLDFIATDALSLKEEPSKDPIAIKQGERKTLTFTAVAKGGLAAGQIRARVSGLNLPEGENASFERTWQLGIRPAYPIEILQYRAALKAGESWQAPPGLLVSYFAEGREAFAKVSSTPPLNIARQIQQLNAYPYGCLEQTTSGIYPFLYVSEAVLERLGIRGEKDEARRAKIDIGIARLLNMQRHNGSFGMWSRDSEEAHWGTVYATDFLLRAREQGFSVSESALKRATDRLLYYMNNRSGINPDYSSDANYLRFSVQAYAGYVLARTHQAPLGALRNIYTQKDVAKSGLPLVQLGIALKLMGDPVKGDELITAGINFEEPARYYWYGDYGSRLRNKAMIYALLSEHDLAQNERDKLLFQISDEVMEQRYLSTQERNAIFLAGRFLLTQPETNWNADLLVGANTSSLTGSNPSRSLVDENVVLPIKITNKSDKTLYSEFSFAAYPREAPAPMENALRISREFLDLDGKPANLTTMKSGDMVIVHIAVGADRRVSDALVVDFLPAGFELENQNLQNASVSLKDAASSLKGLQRQMEQARILHQEYRGDRYVAAVDVQGYGTTHLLYLARAVTPGRYSVPPPTVHSMYRPEWQAIGESSSPLIVAPRSE